MKIFDEVQIYYEKDMWRYVSKERLGSNNIIEEVSGWDRISDTLTKELLGE